MRLTALAAVLAFAVAATVFLLRPGRDVAPAVARATVRHVPPGAPLPVRLAALRTAVRQEPTRADGWTMLAAAELQQVRETGDADAYRRAQAAVDRALGLRPGDAGALTQRAALELSRHAFAAGLRDALAAHRAAPLVVKPLGALVDAQVELGRYADAARTLQDMVDRRPDLAALTRVSYLRELHGDRAGALSALRAADAAGGEVPESTAFVAALRSGLELQLGRPAAARRDARLALSRFPGYGPAENALARVDAAQGRLDTAIIRLRALTARLPLPEHVTLQAEIELAAGRRADARRDLALVRAERRLQQAAGLDVDTEAAIFEADHGDPATAVRLARAAWAAAPSVRSADALGWALARSGRPAVALRWARRALRLGWRDPLPVSHAGLIAAAAGREDLARRWLTAAARGGAALGPWQQARVHARLAALDGRAA